MILPNHPRISVSLAVCGGEPTLASTRLTVSMIRSMMLSGNWTDDALLSNYARLTQEDLDAVRAFCAEAGEPYVPGEDYTADDLAEDIVDANDRNGPFESVHVRSLSDEAGETRIRIVHLCKKFDLVVEEVRGE